MTDFNTKLSKLCQEAMRDAKGDPAEHAEIIERLVNALAFTVAITCKGQTKAMDQMLSGCERQMYEAAAGHKEFGAMMASFGQR